MRAYSGCTADNLSCAKLVCYQECAEGEYSVEYPLAEIAKRYFAENDCSVLSVDYGSSVTFTVAVKAENEVAFNGALTDRLNGKVIISPRRRYHYPFPV